LCPSSPSSLGEVSIITLIPLTLVALNPLAFFVALVAVVFTTLTTAVRWCLLSAANARPLAARLSSADAGATAASRLPAELLLPLVALYCIMADCYVAALAPAPSYCRSRRHCCHCFVIVTARPHLRRNPVRRKKRQKKCIFIYGTTFKKNESGSNIQQIQIWNDHSQKQKKNYGRHPIIISFNNGFRQIFKILIINNRCSIIYNQHLKKFVLRFPQILPLLVLYSREYTIINNRSG
jgi:hypothetical protein